MGDRVSFVTRDGPVFEADRAEIKARWPGWEFGGGVHLRVDGKIYRLSLARPPPATDMDDAKPAPVAVGHPAPADGQFAWGAAQKG